MQTKDAAKTELAATPAFAFLATKASTVKSVKKRKMSKQHDISGHFLTTMVIICVSAVIPQLCENDNGGCEHFCHIARGNVQCSCADGYFLASDDKSCNSNGERSRIHTTGPTKLTETFKADTNSCRDLQVRWNRPEKHQKCFPVLQEERHCR